MVAEFKRLCDVIATIAGMTVIRTSEEAGETEQALPATIVDMDDGMVEPLTEDGLNYVIRPSFSIVVFGVKDLANKTASRDAVMTNVKLVLQKIVAEFRYVEYTGMYFATQEFGKGEAYACGFIVTLPEQTFDIYS